MANQVGVALGLLPFRPLPWLWVALPIAAVGLRGRPFPRRVTRWADDVARCPTWLLANLAGGLLLISWGIGQRADPYFAHDEAVYATRARALSGVAPASQWGNYRPPLLPVLGAPVTAVGGQVLALRLVTLGLALGAIGALAWVAGGRRRRGMTLLTVLLFVAGAAFLRRFPEFLNDLGAAGLLLASAELTVRSRRSGQARLLTVVAALWVVAFYLRYGSLSGDLAIALAAVVAFGPRTWIRPLAPTVRAGLVLGLGLLPHFLWSLVVEGSPWSVLRSAEAAAGRTYPGEGLVEYAVSIPWLYVGDIGGIVVASALVAAWISWGRIRHDDGTEADQRAVLLTVAGLTQVVMLGLSAHGEERFVFFPLMAFLVVGVEAIARWCAGYRRPVLLVVACAVLVSMPATLRWLVDVRFGPATDARRSLAVAGSHVPRSPECLVVTGYRPEMGWNTRCATAATLASVPAALRHGRTVTIVRFEHGRAQPSPEQVSKLLVGRTYQRVLLPSSGSLGAAEIVTIAPTR